jgi:DNA-binding beta-propeller fold protein YncE
MNTRSNRDAIAKSLLAVTALLTLLLALGAPAQIRPSSTLGSQFPLYVTNFGNNTIVKVDSAGARSVFTLSGDLSRPRGLAFDGGGGLYLASFNSNAIVKVDSAGAQSVFSSGGKLDAPRHLAFDGDGNLYVASLSNDAIVKVDSRGAQSVFTSGGNLAGPTGLAFSAAATLAASSSRLTTHPQ